MTHSRGFGWRGCSAATTSSTTLLYRHPRDISVEVCRGMHGGLSLDSLACGGRRVECSLCCHCAVFRLRFHLNIRLQLQQDDKR